MYKENITPPVDYQLRALAEELPPDDASFLVNPESASLEECKKDGVTLVSGLNAFIKNGHSLEGLPQEIRDTFGKIKIWRTKC